LYRRLQFIILAYLACFSLSGVHASAQTPAVSQSPAELAAQFRRIESGLDAIPPSPPSSWPQQWSVATSDGQYSISSQPLRALLGEERIPAARQWLDHMAAELESYSKPAAEAGSNARATLDIILARREFSGVHPPSAWDLFRDRVALWVMSLLERLLGVAAEHGAVGQALFWILVAAAVGLIAMWLIQIWRRTDPMLALPRVGSILMSRDSMAWLVEARKAAAAGQWREAIHAAYWAGIARLQESRTLAEDRTRTPREYLRLMPAGQPASGPLRALTLGLERFWYAKQSAGAQDFEESLKHLETLGLEVR
jgi:hypothetical protein